MRAAVIDATVSALLAHGLDDLSIVEVAHRAGVHPTTIYRRWGSKSNLALDAALTGTEAEIPTPDTGSLRGDLLAVVRGITAFLHTPLGELLVRIALRHDLPEYEAARAGYWLQRFRSGAALFERARARGELRPDVDPLLGLEALIGPHYVRMLIPGAAGRRAAGALRRPRARRDHRGAALGRARPTLQSGHGPGDPRPGARSGPRISGMRPRRGSRSWCAGASGGTATLAGRRPLGRAAPPALLRRPAGGQLARQEPAADPLSAATFIRVAGDETDALAVLFIFRDLSERFGIRVELRDPDNPIAKLRRVELERGRLPGGGPLEAVLVRRPIFKKLRDGRRIELFPPRALASAYGVPDGHDPDHRGWNFMVAGMRGEAPDFFEAEAEAMRMHRGLDSLGEAG